MTTDSRGRYTVQPIFPPGVEGAEAEFATFDEALEEAKRIAARYEGRPRRFRPTLSVANLDCVDLGWPDGLTEDEREAVDAALRA